MDLYSIRNQRIYPNNSPCLVFAPLVRGTPCWRSGIPKKERFWKKKKWIPFCEQEPILDPSRVLHSLAWCKRLLAGLFSSPSRIRCGRVLVTLLVAATASHLNAASSVFLLKASATWLVRPSLYSSTISIKLGKFVLLARVSFFWVRKSLVATLSVLTTNRDPPPRSQVVHYCCHLLLLDHAFRSH